MTINELKIERQSKVDAMASIVENRGDSMNDESLAAIKTFKSEIANIDLKIEAIEELRSVAIKDGRPAEKKEIDAKEEVRSEFGKYIRGAITSKEYEQRAVSVGANGDVVPDTFLADLHEKIKEYSTFSMNAQELVTKDNGEISIPVIDDTTSTGAWTAESGAITKSDFKTSKVLMNAYKVATGIEVSTELIEDSFFNLESYLAKSLAVRLARTMEAAYINGDGSSKPLGILSDPNTKSVTTAESGVVDSADILSAIYSLQPSARVGAKIYVADKVMKALSEEVDTTGRPLLQAQAGATAADPVKHTIGGYPIEVNYNLADPEADSESVFIGNPNNYLVRKVRNINVKRDEFSGMANDTVSFYATARVDGKIVSANDSFVKIVTKA